MLLTTTAKKETIVREYCRGHSRLFAWNCGLYWAANRLHACAKCAHTQGRDFNLRVRWAQKFFIHKANISKLIRWAYFFTGRNILRSGIFPMLEIYPTKLFLIFPVSSSVFNEKIIRKKYGVTGLVFKTDTIDGKKWVKFVAMQQNSWTLMT